MSDDGSELRHYRDLLAPGMPLRDGLERIKRGHTGALVVLGDTPEVDRMCTGGFFINADFTPTALRELAKMDGAIVLSADARHIVRAGVHLMPEAHYPTVETGTRHRTADRVSQQAECAALTVSASMSTISLFLNGTRTLIEDSQTIIARATLSIQTLESYSDRLTDELQRLSKLEFHDQVTVRDVAATAARAQMVLRLLDEAQEQIRHLGTDGRMLQLQLLELSANREALPELLRKDYAHAADTPTEAGLATLPEGDLFRPATAAAALGFTGSLDAKVSPRGFRQLAALEQIPGALHERVVDEFENLQGMLSASRVELANIEGIGPIRARVIRDGLMRLADESDE